MPVEDLIIDVYCLINDLYKEFFPNPKKKPRTQRIRGFRKESKGAKITQLR